MAGASKIEWTEATWNPIVGCSIVSPGCTNCYAMKFAGNRLDGNPKAPHYAGTTQKSKAGPVWTGKLVRAPQHILNAPLKWSKPRTIFVNSMGDLFHESVPDEWILDALTIMAIARQHTFQVLTKRAERMRDFMSNPDLLQEIMVNWWSFDDGMRGVEHWPLANVWLGVSAENQKRADERIPHLLATPAAVRFVSAEPLLGPIDLCRLKTPCLALPGACCGACCGDQAKLDALFGIQYCSRAGAYGWPDRVTCPRRSLDWVIVGGESGPGARPMHPDWARSIRDQCQDAFVPFFFKQWGEWGNFTAGVPAETSGRFNNAEDRVFLPDGRVLGAGNGKDGLVDPKWRESGGAWMSRVGKRAAGRLLDGREHNEMPEVRS